MTTSTMNNHQGVDATIPATPPLVDVYPNPSNNPIVDHEIQQQLAQHQPPQTRRIVAQRDETVLFFVSAIGCTVGWTAVLSNLVFYTATLGYNSYLYLNVCIYAPLFPITVAQTLWDADFDRHYTSVVSFGVRGSVSFGVLVASTMAMAWASSLQGPTQSQHDDGALWIVSLLALSMGTASGVLHGALKQMAAFVYPGCGRLAAAVTAGLQASAVLVLVVSLVVAKFTKNNHNSSSSLWLYLYYGSISMVTLICWMCFQRLMTHSQDVYRSMLRRDSSIQLSALAEGDDEDEQDNNTNASGGEHDDDLDLQQRLLSPPRWDELDPQLPPRMPTMMQLFRQSWPLCVAIFLTVASSMAVASWFNRVPSSHQNANLPQILFYTRLFADLLARPLTLLLPQSIDDNNTNQHSSSSSPRYHHHQQQQCTLWCLMTLVLVRLLFVPYFFLYTMNVPWIPHSDLGMTLGVFAFASTSGFTTTWVYQLAPQFCHFNNNNNNNNTSNAEDTSCSLVLPWRPQPQRQDGPSAALSPRAMMPPPNSNNTQTVISNDAVLLHQTNLLNVCFSASVLLGLLGSLILSGYGHTV